MKRQILSPDPFSVADSGKERNTDCIYDGDAQSEQDSLQEKGMRKDLVGAAFRISWIIQARLGWGPGGTRLTLAFEVAYDEANERLNPATESL